MRIAIFFNVVIGIVLIVFGCKVQNPPKDFAPVMFVILGTLNLFASLLGFWGSYHKKRVLVGFLACGGFSTLLQVGLILALLFAFDSVVEKIEPRSNKAKYDQVAKQLSTARWVALGFVIVEMFTLTMAVLLRFVIKEEQPYNSFDPESAEQRTNTLTSLARDIEKFASKSKTMGERAYDKVRSKMAAKYGNYSAADSDWKSKAKVSWRT
ncbi:hypothetical protein VOLCADRAFT_105984 [Volvox carteri f. nagariensis]|uniref:Uncharacterized protein n=1 Tax=Volvox carteri f. nagariensis TaxID=3068 RepID=D8U438_VOLCA|nr:uncharacterized protein VOLCADRAFT_105984 [Volvox carteri f. nagariensis]EFJ45527.1 hypothetical protein VOLCADRAFT_105984 [Volvox carteri f. nagariensis]|eukprot:XP_002953554.1 hypothetical protein VOLCADRAFT_105984 [Volvox carteri f. nagariensis]